MVKYSNTWNDYTCIDTGDGEKLELIGNIKLRRPDPWCIWKKENDGEWNNVDAYYHRSASGGGYWEYKRKIPEFWNINYKNYKFRISPTPFKHIGLFPEQAYNWDFISDKLKDTKNKKVLNLFAYTGAASIVSAVNGASVTQVDASRGINEWAKENAKINNVDNRIRFITDDVIKFVEREIRRGNKYDGIIMDPPSYGRGPNKELWRLEDNLYELIEKTISLLSDEPLFFIVNCYSSGITPLILENLLNKTINKKFSGKVETDELGIEVKMQNIILPCGIFGRWSK